MSLMQNKQFRNKVLRVLVKIYMNLEKPDFINVCQVNFLKSSLRIIKSCSSVGIFGKTSTCSLSFVQLNEIYFPGCVLPTYIRVRST